MQDLDQALKYLEIASKIKPKNAEVHYDVALIYKAKANYDKAIDEFKKAAKLQPTFVAAKLMLAETYAQDGQTKKAIAYYEDILKEKLENIDNKRIRLNLVKLYKENNQNKKALEQVNKVLKTDPNNLEAKKLKEVI